MIWILLAYVAADLLSGIFHWIEDRYGAIDWPIIGPLVVLPNIEHHRHPTALCLSTYADRNATTLIPCSVFCLLCWYSQLQFAVWMFAFLSQANEIHSWSHQRCSPPIRVLQEIGVLQSPRIHAKHHREPFDQNFCVMSGWTNAVLEEIAFWRGCEILLSLVGLKPREERAIA